MRLCRTATTSLAITLAAFAFPATAQDAAWDTIITNGKVLDGTGNTWFYADVAIKDGRIAAIGDLDPGSAGRVLDAEGLIVAPGFIDVHTHADRGLYTQPLAENFIRNGVTTIITGNCGSSVVDVGEYFDRLTEEPPALNVATLAGHNSILREIKGNVAGELDPEQWELAKNLVRKAMEDGAVGFSTGLIYTPGTWSTTEEIIELQRVAAEYGGIYVTHMRSETTQVVAAIEEALRIGEETGSRVQISHFKMPTDMEQRLGGSDYTLGMVYAARERGQEVWLDQYPYTASSTGITVLIPGWVREDGAERAREILEDPEQLEKVLEDMAHGNEVNRLRTSMEYAQVASSRAYPEFNGMNIHQIAQVFKLREQHGEDVDWQSIPAEEMPEVTMRDQYLTIIDIYLNGGAGMVYHSFNEHEVENIMRSPLVAICSDSGVRTFGEGVPHPRGYGTNARVLGRYVRENGVITLEDAIRKMTTMPATAFRFNDRGAIREGYWADITIFDPDTVIDKATFTDPHNYSIGFRWVIVNGEIVVEDDEITGARPGVPVLGPGVVLTAGG